MDERAIWLRGHLHREIERRLRAETFATRRVSVVCSTCGARYEVSQRNAGTGVCPDCRRLNGHAYDDWYRDWAANIPDERLDELFAAAAVLH